MSAREVLLPSLTVTPMPILYLTRQRLMMSDIAERLRLNSRVLQAQRCCERNSTSARNCSSLRVRSMGARSRRRHSAPLSRRNRRTVRL